MKNRLIISICIVTILASVAYASQTITGFLLVTGGTQIQDKDPVLVFRDTNDNLAYRLDLDITGNQFHIDRGEATTGQPSGFSSSATVLSMTANDRVGIGTTSVDENLHVEDADGTDIQVEATGADSSAGVRLVNDAREWRASVSTGDDYVIRDVTGSNNVLLIRDGALANSQILSSTAFAINEDGLDLNTRMETTGVSNAFNLDAGDDKLTINVDLYKGSTKWNLVDEIDGEVIADDTIDEDPIDWGTGAGQVSAVDVPIADSSSYYTGTEVETALTEVTPRNEWLQNGFATKSTSTLTWTDTGPNYTLSLQPTGVSFEYWDDGIKYTTTGDTVQIDNTKEGIHVIYYEGDTLTSLANPTDAEVSTIIRGSCLVSIIYWDTSTATAIYVGEERHGNSMSPTTHSYDHFKEGLAYISPGLGLNTFDTGGGGSVAEAQFGVDAGQVADEDLFLTIDAVVSTTGLPIYHMTGAAQDWNKTVVAGYSARTLDNTSNDRLAWNNIDAGGAGVWGMTEVGNNDFVLCHVFATTEKDTPMIAIMGQADYATRKKARAGALVEIMSLIFGDLPLPEIRPIGTVIMKTNLGYASANNATVQDLSNGDSYVDWRSETIERAEISTSATLPKSLVLSPSGTKSVLIVCPELDHPKLDNDAWSEVLISARSIVSLLQST